MSHKLRLEAIIIIKGANPKRSLGDIIMVNLEKLEIVKGTIM
jgi:hypothetical protein